MENIRCQIIKSDVAIFDERVAPLKEEALERVRSFRDVQRLYSERRKRKLYEGEFSITPISPHCHLAPTISPPISDFAHQPHHHF